MDWPTVTMSIPPSTGISAAKASISVAIESPCDATPAENCWMAQARVDDPMSPGPELLDTGVAMKANEARV